jgi:hypothetical protein
MSKYVLPQTFSSDEFFGESAKPQTKQHLIQLVGPFAVYYVQCLLFALQRLYAFLTPLQPVGQVNQLKMISHHSYAPVTINTS